MEMHQNIDITRILKEYGMFEVEFDYKFTEAGSVLPDSNALLLRRECRCYAE